ncbi:MAG TPA: hypothetical protein VGG27_14790 [Magnetospirillaceae bacterium]|jgi:hypothetical protein
MKTLLLLAAAGGLALTLSGCGNGEEHPMGTVLDPPCMPDGSTVQVLLKNPDGTYGDPRAKKEYCPWNKK